MNKDTVHTEGLFYLKAQVISIESKMLHSPVTIDTAISTNLIADTPPFSLGEAITGKQNEIFLMHSRNNVWVLKQMVMDENGTIIEAEEFDVTRELDSFGASSQFKWNFLTFEDGNVKKKHRKLKEKKTETKTLLCFFFFLFFLFFSFFRFGLKEEQLNQILNFLATKLF